MAKILKTQVAHSLLPNDSPWLQHLIKHEKEIMKNIVHNKSARPTAAAT